METCNSHGVSSYVGSSVPDLLEPEVARKILFERILDQLADSSLFSSSLSPAIFIVYAHNNEKEGAAYDECVRDLITWLERIHARVLSDHSPLPPFVPGIDGTDPIGNILANQMCLLPPSCYGSETPKVGTVDKVVVCGSEVLEAYCSKQSAWAYIDGIAHICTQSASQLTEVTLESAIRQRVENECDSQDFHHVLTELAFLQIRKASLPEEYDMVPLVLSQKDPSEAPLRYLPVFQNTDVKLKLKSPATSSLHRLFFKLLNRLFPEDKDFIQPFRECYDLVSDDLGLDDEGVVAQEKFDDIVNQSITKAFQKYWKLSCVVVRDGKLQAYTGKLNDQMSQVLEDVAQSTQHEILEWLSPKPASMNHEKYHDLGTSRMQGTCDWVIKDEEFRRWYAHESSALLFLRGKMGTGKTYSTSRVIDWVGQGLETNANDEAFAYFYCNKQDPARSEPKEILRNIIRQLATGPWKENSENTAVHKTVHSLWLKSRRQGILSTFAQWEACLLELIDTYPRTTIVLDALDECNIEQRQSLINLLVALANRNAHAKPVKIFVAARPEEDIRRQLEEDHVILMQDKHNAADIDSFVRMKISEHRRWFKMPRDFQNEVVDTLLEKSGDMFLFASLQIQRLLNCDTKAAMRKRLEIMPDSLKSTYEEMLQSATPDPDERELLDRALEWVTCSARPLTTKELLLAVSQDPESDGIKTQMEDLDEDLMLKWTQNLLILDDSPDDGFSRRPRVWRLAHQAVAEYLESTCHKSSVAHSRSGTVCLLVLLDNFGANTTNSWSNRKGDFKHGDNFECPCRPTSDFGEHGIHRVLPDALAEYAVYAWPSHVRAQEDSVARDIDGLSRALRQFLGQPDEGSAAYKRWLRHAFGAQKSYSIPDWSIFQTRPMGDNFRADMEMMAPTTLACHLGIYNCLQDWWGSSIIDYDRLYCPTLWWSPTLRWQELRLGPHWIFRWSLVALACVHNEPDIIRHILRNNVRINTTEEDNVPPIVAAAVADSVETVKDLIKCGADICSPFTVETGHILLCTIQSNSLGVMKLLLQQPGLSQVLEVEAILRSFSIGDFASADAMEMLIGMGVSVNTPLKAGTLLTAAVERGWENMLYALLEKGGEAILQADLSYDGVLEAVISSCPARPSTVTLTIDRGAHVSSRIVTRAWERMRWCLQRPGYHDIESWKEIIQLLLACKPDLNETWTHTGLKTSALIEAVSKGDLDHVRLLLAHGANANLKVESECGDALGCVFQVTLHRRAWDGPYPARALINALVDEGASLEKLEGDRLHIALAAVAFAGLENMVQESLNLGASPYACWSHKYRTALGAAAASEHSRAPAIVQALLNNGPDVSEDRSFFQTARDALDSPLYKLLDFEFSTTDLNGSPDTWLESATALALHHAFWDIDFMQWDECLQLRRPNFRKDNAEALAKLQLALANSRIDFFLKFPGAASEQEWSIKDAKEAIFDERSVLHRMKDILMLAEPDIQTPWEPPSPMTPPAGSPFPPKLSP